MRILFASLLGFTVALFAPSAAAGPLQPVVQVTLSGDIQASSDISAVAGIQGFLLIAADEGVGPKNNENIVQLLEKIAENHYRVSRDILLFEGDKTGGKEMDIEGIATQGDTVYVIGSHALKRPRVKTRGKYDKNRAKFHADEIEAEASRDRLYRFTIDPQGGNTEPQFISLRDIIDNDSVLGTFSAIPSKENGVDIEGIAADGEQLYIGFRGPVLRGNNVPVMKLTFDAPSTNELLYVDLDGRGIRDIARVSDGFLILAGPVGNGPASYQLYHWNGRDVIPGKDRERNDRGKMSLLGELGTPGNGKAEGLAVLGEENGVYELLVVYDGIENGGAKRFRVSR